MKSFSSDFLLFLKEFKAEHLFDKFIEHFGYGTGDIYISKGEIVACVRWNISKSGKVAHIIDLFILPNNNSIEIMRYFGFRGKEKFPQLRYIKFDRGLKQGTTNRVYKLSSLIK